MGVISTFFEALGLIKKDKVVLSLSAIPILIGGTIYYFFGSWGYGRALNYGRSWIENQIQSSTWGDILYYILISVLTVFMFFLVSWTFVLLVSLIASPFNDLISSRVEKIILGQTPDPLSDSMGGMFRKIFSTLFNELKKIFAIMLISIASLVLSFIPFLVPISIFLSGLVLSTQFLDYNWSRRELRFRQCMRDLRSSIMSYAIGGVGFLFLMTIPVINILSLPVAVVFFTIIFVRKNGEEKREQVPAPSAIS